jgi:hypothetical protein
VNIDDVWGPLDELESRKLLAYSPFGEAWKVVNRLGRERVACEANVDEAPSNRGAFIESALKTKVCGVGEMMLIGGASTGLAAGKVTAVESRIRTDDSPSTRRFLEFCVR